MPNFPWKWIILGLIVVGLVVALITLPVGQWLDSFNTWVSDLGPIGLVIFVGVYIVAAVLFAPCSILTIGAGAAFGLTVGTVVVSGGSTIGAAFAFLISRYVARDVVKKHAGRSKNFDAIDRAIGEEGWKIVGLLRLSPLLPYNMSNYFYGLTAVRFWPYVIASWVGMMPGTVMYVYFGVAGKATIEAASDAETGSSPAKLILYGVGLVATIAVAVFITNKAKKIIARINVEEAGEPSGEALDNA